jgi:hypothetical protein
MPTPSGWPIGYVRGWAGTTEIAGACAINYGHFGCLELAESLGSIGKHRDH